ncbi:hypothetical protein [Polaribacter aquimarinus]|uniref:Uncharacterized protein n=1 Tax=Polaribacter aquimarinus TaxID=2100726 RepID=A0A2U2JBF8_9FLAO|nr:hypothetical protein [Polaribacter aquimarinus]PWG05679.1 hypothetical protein DIS07_04335 [Polaribacter aquimarinus]
MQKKGIVKIVSNKRAWYERLLGAVFFSIATYSVIIFYINNGVAITEDYYKISFRVLAGLIVLVAFGIKFSRVLSHYFDLELNKYKAYWSVGPFGFGSWVNTNKLDRVSTFLNNKNYCEVNIWDVENNKYSITSFYEIDDAVNFGRELAIKLDIKFKERK